MVGGNGIGDILHQNRLTSLGLGNDQCALSLTNGGEEIDDTNTGVRRGLVATEGELLLREERSQVLEGYTVTYF